MAKKKTAKRKPAKKKAVTKKRKPKNPATPVDSLEDPPIAEKHAGGAPSKYKPAYKNQALILAEKGFTDADVAAVFGVTEQTINNWKKQFPQFFESLKKGKKIADQKVVQSLYQRALGYSHPDIHISSYEGDITKTDIIKHYPPDPTACIFWLKNRDPKNWKDRKEITGEGGGPISVQVVHFDKKTK